MNGQLKPIPVILLHWQIVAGEGHHLLCQCLFSFKSSPALFFDLSDNEILAPIFSFYCILLVMLWNKYRFLCDKLSNYDRGELFLVASLKIFPQGETALLHMGVLEHV